MDIADLKAAPYNPREISAESLRGLGVSLEKFGDISGIVWNKRSCHLVAGHQRLNALRTLYANKLKIEGSEIVTSMGERFPIRVVDWDAATEKAANVAANNPHISGMFTDDLEAVLAEIGEASPDLYESLHFNELAIQYQIPPGADGKEFDESAADDVRMTTCPKCGEEFPV